jgi:branched-subunit amino acid aminotransferase/4-amino-4-deoxychorismate lyase
MELSDPRDAVWTGVGWDGGGRLLAPSLHFARMRRHAARLGIALPDDFEQQFQARLATLQQPGPRSMADGQPPFLIRGGVLADGSIFLKASVPPQWPTEPLTAISQPAPMWEQPVAGTKHGNWKPNIAARNAAVAAGAHVALLFDSGDVLIDGDRCAVLVLGADDSCVVFHPLHEEGALDSVSIDQLRPRLETAGFSVRGRRLTRNDVLAASEVLVLGSGMGVRALGSLDGVAIGGHAAQRPLHEAAWRAWLQALQENWATADG